MAARPSIAIYLHTFFGSVCCGIRINRGKGAALKIAIRFVLEHFSSLAGIVTADADRRHDPDDIRRIITSLQVQRGSFSGLGCQIPKRCS
jgi:hypothetical protein